MYRNLTLALILALVIPGVANAQVLDAIRGHIQDLKARFTDHQKIDGEVLKRGEIDTSAKGQGSRVKGQGSRVKTCCTARLEPGHW